MRPILLTVVMCVAFEYATPDGRQTADSARFDSASITVNASNDAAGGCCRIQPDGRVTASNVTVRQLIQSAYQRYIFDERPISDLPAWAGSIRFDIAAVTSAPPAFDADGAAPQLAAMLRNLLADRFKLRIRTEASNQPIYVLSLANGRTEPGPGVRRVDVDCGALMAKMIRGEMPPKPLCATASYPGRLVTSALPMSAIAGLLSKIVDRPVVNRTDLDGRFDIDLEAVEIRPPGPFGPSYRPSDTKQSIFSSLLEQLGLELKPDTGPVEVLIVEHVEKPTEG